MFHSAEPATPSPRPPRSVQPSPSCQSLDARIGNMTFNGTESTEDADLEEGEYQPEDGNMMDVTMDGDEDDLINY